MFVYFQTASIVEFVMEAKEKEDIVRHALHTQGFRFGSRDPTSRMRRRSSYFQAAASKGKTTSSRLRRFLRKRGKGSERPAAHRVEAPAGPVVKRRPELPLRHAASSVNAAEPKGDERPADDAESEYFEASGTLRAQERPAVPRLELPVRSDESDGAGMRFQSTTAEGSTMTESSSDWSSPRGSASTDTSRVNGADATERVSTAPPSAAQSQTSASQASVSEASSDNSSDTTSISSFTDTGREASSVASSTAHETTDNSSLSDEETARSNSSASTDLSLTSTALHQLHSRGARVSVGSSLDSVTDSESRTDIRSSLSSFHEPEIPVHIPHGVDVELAEEAMPRPPPSAVPDSVRTALSQATTLTSRTDSTSDSQTTDRTDANTARLLDQSQQMTRMAANVQLSADQGMLTAEAGLKVAVSANGEVFKAGKASASPVQGLNRFVSPVVNKLTAQAVSGAWCTSSLTMLHFYTRGPAELETQYRRVAQETATRSGQDALMFAVKQLDNGMEVWRRSR